MPFLIVFGILILYALLVMCLKNTSYSMHNAYGYLFSNLWLRYMINFFLPLLYYSTMTIRDKDVSMNNLRSTDFTQTVNGNCPGPF